MKKNLLFAIIVSALLMILAACSSKSEEGSTGTASESSGPTTIEFWYGLGSEADLKMKEIIDGFNKSQDEVIVKAVPQASYSETYQKLQAAIAAKDAPGLFITGSSSLVDLASKSALAPLNKYASEDSIYDKEDFLDVFIDAAYIGDELYALPAYGSTQVMYFRKDIYEQAGMDPKEVFASWENVAEASKKLQAQGVVEYGHLPMWGSGNLIDIALSNGGEIISEDGKEVLIDSDAWVDAWEFIRKQIHEEKTMKVNSGGQGWEYWYKTIDEVLAGKAAGYTGSSGDKGDLDFTVIDSIPQPGLNGNAAAPTVGALFMAVPAVNSDEEIAAAYKFMSYFSSSEVNVDWAEHIGYIPVRESAMEVPEYAAFIEENPYAGIPYKQALTGSPDFVDPTGGKIVDAISIAADKVELQNVSVEEALKEAKKVAQEALDELN
ncbi:ABC transporter substrate-binding protein [Psychrobacillus soli]|uniref:ABC transporter substrate-binding protein n=1 Tax=Psychrobacillus soli TaxID=1543965 RepID=A0A544TFS8_9BACI|nr:ABC transporter substrate-binding protein [Psychrobacillus soli]TQR16277.1 ABC transporter substrate-binding protein [Psychrobacillus soli]